jgi:hypothetical protein
VIYGQPCSPNAASNIENQYLRAGVSNMGDIYSGPIAGSLEFPLRTQAEIASGVKARYVVFAGGIWTSSKDNGETRFSGIRYRTPNTTAHFLPGPIKLKDGSVNPQSCVEFDRMWIVKAKDIKDHIADWANNSAPLSKINPSILNWPAKGNKIFTVVPIEDELAPFVDVNRNGIYDPEYGDYPKIKGDEAHFAVINDVSSGRYGTGSDRAVGLEIQMMTYVYRSPIFNGLGTSIFHENKIIKKTTGNAEEFIFSLFIDPDIGDFFDDYVGCDTSSNTGFAYNAQSFQSTNSPIVATRFLNQKMNAFSCFINAAGSPLSDPSTIAEHRHVMEGRARNGASFTVVGNAITPGNPVTRYCYFGNPSNPAEWSMASANLPKQDIRYVMSTDSRTLEYNKPVEYNYVTYLHQLGPYSGAGPNVKDSVLPNLEDVKGQGVGQDCNFTLTARITPDTSGKGKGKIEITSTGTSKGPLQIRWSSNERTRSIFSKDSGKYRVVVIDSLGCMKDSVFYIPNVNKGVAGASLVFLNDVMVYPNPFQNNVTIENPGGRKIESVSIFDMIGKLVYKKNIQGIGDRIDIDLHLLPKGTYQLTIATDQGMKNLVLQK